MTHAQQHSHSIWQEGITFPRFDSLKESITTDVCIVGAGIAGLLTAYRLLKKGHKVVVLEKDDLGFNETCHSTAHVCNALDDRFFKLRQWHGREGVRLAYGSHTAAIELIENIVKEESIDCDFQRVNGYLFLAENDPVRNLEKRVGSG